MPRLIVSVAILCALLTAGCKAQPKERAITTPDFRGNNSDFAQMKKWNSNNSQAVPKEFQP